MSNLLISVQKGYSLDECSLSD
ncbi:hypothetical protein F383_37680 [Gossypium arboreum]|uniref:Uncharacterized protein n=1 Tax=Gossypium arboreum TaxID=29729 RepID=A0A0B0M884_GOSAR|nr:hypothetical protein F383_37680 [Gossypium arboreum]